MNKLNVNINQRNHMCFYFGEKKLQLKSIEMDVVDIDKLAVAKLLGVMVNNKLNCSDHLNCISKKEWQCI